MESNTGAENESIGQSFSAEKTVVPIEQNNLQTTEQEKPVDIAEISKELFRKDLAHMSKVFDQESVPSKDVRGQRKLDFRAFIIMNPNDSEATPIIITRPDEDKFIPLDYSNGNSATIYHADIWQGWRLYAEKNPDSDRAKIVNQINNWGGIDKMAHVYMRLNKDVDGSEHLVVKSGWSSLVKNNDSKEDAIEKLGEYGVAEVNNDSWEGDREKMEKIILEDMMMPTIEKNANQLSKILTPRAVRQYRNLATIYQTNTNPNKDSYAYQVYQDYQNILDRLPPEIANQTSESNTAKTESVPVAKDAVFYNQPETASAEPVLEPTPEVGSLETTPVVTSPTETISEQSETANKPTTVDKIRGFFRRLTSRK